MDCLGGTKNRRQQNLLERPWKNGTEKVFAS